MSFSSGDVMGTHIYVDGTLEVNKNGSLVGRRDDQIKDPSILEQILRS